jgi:hypothetical protein
MEDTQVVSPPNSDAGVSQNSESQVSSPEGGEQTQTTGQVEPAGTTSRSTVTESPQPFETRQARQLARLREEIRTLKDLYQQNIAKPSQPVTAPQTWQPKPLPLEQFHPEGVAAWVQDTLSGMKQQLMQETQGAFTQWQQDQIQYQRDQEVVGMLDKYRENGQLERVEEILETHPELNEYSRSYPKEAMKKVEEIMEHERAPLTPKKTRTGIVGSGTPPGTTSQSNTVESIMNKAKSLTSQFSERSKDPEFMKEYNQVMAQLSQLTKK